MSQTPSRGYLICCIERTGSNLLAQALADTGLAGRPIEYFNPALQDDPQIRNILGDADLIGGLPKVLRGGTTSNGIFGAKVHWGHFRHFGMLLTAQWSPAQRLVLYETLRSLPELLSLPAAVDLLHASFPEMAWEAPAYTALQSQLPDLRMIWLKRRNVVARAISDFRARQTGRWYLPLSDAAKVAVSDEADFDFAEIHIRCCLGVFQQQMWQRFFREREILPHVVVYEDMAAQYEKIVRDVLQFLEVGDTTTVVHRPRSAIQSDRLSKHWEERYLALSAKKWGLTDLA